MPVLTDSQITDKVDEARHEPDRHIWRDLLDSLGSLFDGTAVNATATEINTIADGITATAAEVNRACDVSARLIDAGASVTLSQATHDGTTVALDQASGSAVTLPAASGSGMRLRIVVSTTVTSNNHTITCDGTDEFAGQILATDTDTSDTLVSYPAVAADDFDTITMDGSTKGGLQGDVIELEDVAEGVWALEGFIKQTGSPATPLSSS